MEQKAKGKAAKAKDDKNDRSAKMSAVKELLDKGKKNGSLTYKEIMEAMDHIDLSPEQIEKIYEARVGQEPEQSEKESIDKEYQYRIENNIYCPGFKDSGKESNSSGDFHLWKQILKYATQNDKSVIFT